ncbi:decarboxylase [Candidatus Woesearchaeota archaeon]|nr:decarboxylase [Candidatus Woesearchaeota archaeon]
MTARFILSKKKLLAQYHLARELADEVSYSAKTNYEAGKLLEELTDSNFSLHSMESLDSVKDKRRVWFLAQAWNAEEIELLLKEGVSNFIVDNETDLATLLKCIEGKKEKINLLLRMRLKENTIHTGKYFVFGMRAEQVNRLIPELRKNSHTGKLGLHIHRKTQNVSEWSLKEEFSESVRPETFESIDYVCIGGGLPVKYKNFTTNVQEDIFAAIRELRTWLNGKGIKMIIEPGRFIAAPCIELEANIKSIHENNIIIDCSVYNSAMDTFVANIKLEVEGELESGTAYTIKGQTPCSMDIFRYRVFLNNPRIGDRIRFLNAGAYNFASDFCGLRKIQTVVVE